MLLEHEKFCWGSFLKNTICTISCGLLSLAHIGLFAGSASWNVDGNGNWTKESNWVPSSGLNTDFPNGKNDIATFPPFKITKPRTITVDGTFDVWSLNFNTEYRYILSSGQLNIYDSINVIGKAEIKSTLTLQDSNSNKCPPANIECGGPNCKCPEPPSVCSPPMSQCPSPCSINMMVTGAGNCGPDNGNLLISGNVLGNCGITKQGEGRLKLSGVNTYTGMTTIQSGVFQAGAVNTFSPNSKVMIANTSGVVFDLNNFDNGIANLSGGGNLGGNINLGTATLTLGDECDAVYAGAIFGTGGLTKMGSGIFVLSGNTSTYSGVTMIQEGTFQAGICNAFSQNSKVVLANNSGASLNLCGYDNQIPSLNGGGMFGGDVLLGNGTLTLGDDTSSIFSGSIFGTGSLVKQGTGMFTLTRTNIYTGPTTVALGTLDIEGLITSPTTIQTGATLQGGGIIVGNVIVSGTLKPNNMTIIGNCTLATGSTLEIGMCAEAGCLLTSGTFTINDDVLLTIVATGTFTPGTSYEIVSAAGGIVGSFSKMPFPEKFIIKTSPHSITIEMK